MIDYHVDSARKIVVTRAAGRVSATEVSAHFVRLMRDPLFSAELNALIIAADVQAIPSATELAIISPLVRAWSKRRAGVKWAFVLPNQATRDFVESALQGARLTAVTSRCFLSETAALGWLEPTALERAATTPREGAGT